MMASELFLTEEAERQYGNLTDNCLRIVAHKKLYVLRVIELKKMQFGDFNELKKYKFCDCYKCVAEDATRWFIIIMGRQY